MVKTADRPAILVVEDDPSMLEMIALLLEDEDYRVLQATSGKAALSLMEETKPNLIISDIMMPGMDGFELCEQVRTQPSFTQIPFIFLTARSQRTDMRRGMGLGADDYLTKPFEAEELLSSVKVRLARAAETQAMIDKASADLQRKVIQALTHEFRTPLALVVGYTDLLESTGHVMNEGDFQTILQGLHSGSRRLMGLVEDFLLLSRLRTGDVAREIRENPRQTVEPEQIVHRLIEEAKGKAAAKNVLFTTTTAAPGATIAVRPEDLTEIVRRLVDNAIKFSKSEGGRVMVTTRQDGHYWVLEITDHGVGIRREALSWIFEAFRQVDREKMEQQGSGVGLTIVRGLTEVYGGRVGVESTPGQGSSFTVWLPLTAG